MVDRLQPIPWAFFRFGAPAAGDGHRFGPARAGPNEIPAAEPRHFEEGCMNWDEIKGSWKEMRGRVREQWGKLTDDDVDIIAGRRDRLVGLIQQRYGTLKEDADAQVTAFERRLAEMHSPVNP